jgi:hypothetical protein
MTDPLVDEGVLAKTGFTLSRKPHERSHWLSKTPQTPFADYIRGSRLASAPRRTANAPEPGGNICRSFTHVPLTPPASSNASSKLTECVKELGC